MAGHWSAGGAGMAAQPPPTPLPPAPFLLQLAQTTMRSELGKITLDKTFEERDALNAAIVRSIQDAAAAWGLRCLRYEIRDIQPPPGVRAAMELQAEAERRKRVGRGRSMAGAAKRGGGTRRLWRPAGRGSCMGLTLLRRGFRT